MNDIEKVKNKIDIVDFIQSYIPLKKMGWNYKVACPFHNEKSPSFVVSPERQIWHCFGCGKGGDVFRFLMEYEHIEFAESLKYLADRAGIKLSGPVHKTEAEKKRETIYALNHLASQFYSFLLANHPVGKKAQTYLKSQRKMTDALIKTFGVGFAPQKDDTLSTFLTKKKKYFADDLIIAGLAYRKNGRLVDFFRNRIMFPIVDARDNIIAFSGRALDNTTLPKYVNTRETPIYIKGDTLFGINIAKEGIRKTGRVIVVEGEFDVISSFKEGIDNVVAIKGTALTENQIKILKRYAPKITLCFDTDIAGSDAQRRSIQMLEQQGVTTSIIVPPQGKDPDELLNENPLAFKNAVKKDINVYDYVIDSAVKNFDKSSADGKKTILEKTLPFLVLIENEVLKEHYFKKLAKDIDSSLESVTKQAEKIQDKSPKKEAFDNKKVAPREEMLSQYLLSLIIQSEDVSRHIKIASEIMEGVAMPLSSFERIFSQLKKQMGQPFEAKSFVKKLPEELHGAFDASFLAPLPEFVDREHSDKEIKNTAHEIKTLSIKKMLKKISEDMKKMENEKNDKGLEKLSMEFDRLSRFLTTISHKP